MDWLISQIDKSAVRPGFAYNLARYFPSGANSDQERCIELMEKLGMSSDPVTWYLPGMLLCDGNLLLFHSLKNNLVTIFLVHAGDDAQIPARPGSAGVIKNDRRSDTRNPDLFYLTTNRREFAGTFGPPAGNAR